MAKSFLIRLNQSSIKNAIKQLNEYKFSINKKMEEICRRLAEIGATRASIGYSRAIYNGEKDIDISAEETQNGYSIIASGETVLIVEFGAGVTYGYGHPMSNEFGMGPGTYPDGKGHWDNPKGWWIPKENGGGHTYGNPPSMVMYNTAKELKDAVLKIAREVFSSD